MNAMRRELPVIRTLRWVFMVNGRLSRRAERRGKDGVAGFRFVSTAASDASRRDDERQENVNLSMGRPTVRRASPARRLTAVKWEKFVSKPTRSGGDAAFCRLRGTMTPRPDALADDDSFPV
jgi:hypothetical protein